MAKTTTAPQGAVSTAIANAEQAGALVAADSALFAAHAGAGLENVTAKDILVPRIAIIQGLSPQVVPGKPEYDENARVGMIYDVGLGEPIGNELMFLPILYRKDWLEWAPRASGKGLVGIHSTAEILDKCKPDEKGRPILPNGNYIAETAQFFGLNMNARNRLSFIPMASTQLKKSRAWLTLSTGEKLPSADGGEFTPPLFYRCYKLTTIPESNTEGSWVGWKIERGPALPEMEGWKQLYESLLETHRQISSGAMRADLSGMEGEGSSTAASADESRAM